MEGINLNTIPAWVPGILMLYTGFIWLVTRYNKIRMDTRAIAYTLFTWGIIYTLSSVSPQSDGTHEELLARIFISRLVIILLCLSQSLPLTVSYVRELRRIKDGELE